MMTRRKFLMAATAAASGVTSSLSVFGNEPPGGQAAARTAMGVNIYSFGFGQHGKSTLEFLDYCASLGAGGAQAALSSLEPEYTKKVRERAEKLEMYLEIITSLPEDDTAVLERTVMAAKEAGAICLRSACLNGRRYETFSTLDEWNRFVAESKTRICLLYTSPSPRDLSTSRMPSSA